MQTQTPLKNKLRQRRSAAKPLAQLFTSLSELVNYYKPFEKFRNFGAKSESFKTWAIRKFQKYFETVIKL